MGLLLAAGVLAAIVPAALLGARAVSLTVTRRRLARLAALVAAGVMVSSVGLPWFGVKSGVGQGEQLDGTDLVAGRGAAEDVYGGGTWLVGDCGRCADTNQFPVAGPLVAVLAGVAVVVSVGLSAAGGDRRAWTPWVLLAWCVAASMSAFAAGWNVLTAAFSWGLSPAWGLGVWLASAAVLTVIGLVLRADVVRVHRRLPGRIMTPTALAVATLFGIWQSSLYPLVGGMWSAYALGAGIGLVVQRGRARRRRNDAAAPQATEAADPPDWSVGFALAMAAVPLTAIQFLSLESGHGRRALLFGWLSPVCVATALTLITVELFSQALLATPPKVGEPEGR